MIGTKYRLGERIGAGGMAEVFRAILVGTQGFEHPVAIKRVLPKWSADPHFAAMFVNEARIMAALRHPNVVAVTDFARDDEACLFLVMELVEGINLRRLLQTDPVPVPVAIYLVTELLRGLGHLHDRVDAEGKPLGLVHRDLSPGNVLLSWEGAVKLGDFGLANAYAGTPARDSDAYGTPGYMSPEQVAGGPIDGGSDLFAVGVILYGLLTGTSPFVGADRIELDFAVLRQRIEPPRVRRPDLPADLDALTMRLLAREREQRPASAQAVIEALERSEGASPLGRTHLVALLRERFLDTVPPAASDSEARRVTTSDRSPVLVRASPTASDSEARRVTERLAAPGEVPAPRAPSRPGAEGPEAARGQGSAPPASVSPPSRAAHGSAAAPPPAPAEPAPAPRQTQSLRPPERPSQPRPAPVTNVRTRGVWAAGLLLVLGSVTGSMLLRRDADPARPAEVTQAATRTDGKRAVVDEDCRTTPPRTSTEIPEALASAPLTATPIQRASATTARLTRDPAVPPSQPDAPSPTDFFVKEIRP